MNQSLRAALFCAFTLWAAVAFSPAQAGTQLLDNPSFELPVDFKDTSSRWRTATPVTSATLIDGGHSGQSAVELKINATQGAAGIVQRLSANGLEGTVLTVSASVRPKAAGSAVQLWVRQVLPTKSTFVGSPLVTPETGTWAEISVPVYVQSGAKELIVGVSLYRSGPVDVDDIALETLPSVAAGAVVPADVDRAIETISSLAYRAPDVHWNSIRQWAKTGKGVSLASSVDLALSALADGHSFRVQPTTGPATGATSVGKPATQTGPTVSAQGRIGVITLPTFTSVDPLEANAAAKTLADGVRQRGADVCGWVLDLRTNGGGNMYPALAGVSDLLGEGTAGYFVYRDGSDEPWAVSSGASGKGDLKVDVGASQQSKSLSSAPVAVLIGSGTKSSGEAIAISFIGRPRTNLFGSKTAGLTTANRFVELGPDVKVALSTSQMADRNKRQYVGGVQPTGGMEPAGTDPAVAAEAWLAAECKQ